jgi:hypothetical protein
MAWWHSGAEALDVNFMDGAEFFMMLFGSDKFEHLVRELLPRELVPVAPSQPLRVVHEWNVPRSQMSPAT